MTKSAQNAAILLTGQPNPTGSGPSVTEAILTHPAVGRSELLRNLFRLRRGQGRSRYGSELRAFNGRSARRDLVQELVDAAVYAEQERLEGTGAQATVDAVLDLLGQLAEDPDHEPWVSAREAALREELRRTRERLEITTVELTRARATWPR